MVLKIKVAHVHKMTKSEKGGNSVRYIENLPNVNQVIYTLDTICEPNIMTLAQAVLEIFCPQGSIGFTMGKSKKKKNVEKGLHVLLCNDKSDGKEKNILVLLIFILMPRIKFQDHISNGS